MELKRPDWSNDRRRFTVGAAASYAFTDIEGNGPSRQSDKLRDALASLIECLHDNRALTDQDVIRLLDGDFQQADK